MTGATATMTDVTAKSAAGATPPQACSQGHSSILGDWKLWVAVAVVALAAGATLHWGWLVAIGIAPLLLKALPCVAMCSLGLCMRKGARA